MRSFDIFDTCLVRSCGSALTVFDILAREILRKDAPTEAVMDFARERVEGEKRARSRFVQGGCEEVSFDQIYECCDFSGFTSLATGDIQSRELEIERAVLLPVKTVREEIQGLHDAGRNVVFISDMYLPYEFVLSVLKDFGFFRDGDRIYLSSRELLSKKSGRLFEKVLADCGLKPAELLHSGDDELRDIVIPDNMGIKVRKIEHQMSKYEKLLAHRDYSLSLQEASTLASISSSLRLTLGEDPKTLVAADFIAPIFVPFVYSVLSNARSRGLKKLYFVARDGYIFHQIAKRFQDVFPEIELHYLYVSRTALYLPGLETFDFEHISGMFWNFHEVCAEDILDRLQLELLDADAFKKRGADSASVLNTMLDSPEFLEALGRKRDEQKALAEQYLLQEGLGGEGCAIVDLTGSRKCQIAINRILSDAGKEKVFAYFFSVIENRVPGGDYSALFFEERTDRNPLNLSLMPHDLFEQYFCITPQLRTRCYERVEDRVRPVFENGKTSSSYSEEVFGVNSAVCEAFADRYALMLGAADHKALAQAAASVYSAFYNSPEKKYLNAFEGLTFSESRRDSRPLLEKKCLVKVLLEKKPLWRAAEFVYNCPIAPTILLKAAKFLKNV